MATDATGATLTTPWKVPDLDTTLDSHVDDRHGYLRVTVSPTDLHGDYITVPRPQESWHHDPTTADSFTLNPPTLRSTSWIHRLTCGRGYRDIAGPPGPATISG